ncbi:MAG: hypothetical protein ACRCTJ_01260 [Brevinema sp.]
MEILLPLLSLLVFTGLLFYFRHTDARNISVHSLQDFLKQSERRIETMLHKKEKEFNDKMIASEIAIDRMHRISQVLQEKMKEFDQDMFHGQELLASLRAEIQGIEYELSTYKQINAEFKDAEEKIGTVLEMKEQSKTIAKNMESLQDSMNLFESDYKIFVDNLKQKTSQELLSFHHNLQKDLDKYLLHAREQMDHKDQEISIKIGELSGTSDSIANRIKEFKDYIEINLVTLQQKYDSDIELAKTIAHTNLEDIFDMWSKFKEDMSLDKDQIENTIRQKEQFFQESEATILGHISSSMDQVNVLFVDTQAKFEHALESKAQSFDIQVNDAFYQLSQKADSAKNRLEKDLEGQIENIRGELTRISTAFVEQEFNIEERFKALNTKTTEYLSLEEQKFQTTITDLRDSVDNTNTYANSILADFREKLEEKINENLEGVEENFRSANQERLQKSIEEITKVLEKEYKEQYQETIQSMFRDAEDLKKSVSEKQKYVDFLEQRFQEINQHFDLEKDKIGTMIGELEKDKDKALSVASELIMNNVQSLSNEVKILVQDLFDRERANFDRENQAWQEQYAEIVGEARDKYNSIHSEITNIEHMLTQIKDTSLTKLKDESERLVQESSRRIDDLKHYASDHMRGCKDDLHHQLELARQEITVLKEDLWKQEKEVRDVADKDLDRLTTRIKNVDKQLVAFYKKSEKLDKADELIQKLHQSSHEVSQLRKEMEDLMGNLKNSYYEGKEVLQNMATFRDSLESQVNNLSIYTEEAERTREQLIHSINDVKAVSSIFQQLDAEKERAKNIEELLLKNLSSFNDLQESLDILQQRKEMVDEILGKLNLTDQGVLSLSNSTETLISKVEEISTFSDELQKRFSSLQSDMTILAGDQTKIHSAVSRFGELDHMIVHIDAEVKRLDKMREWIAKAMNNIEKAGANMGLPRQNPDDADDQNVKNILRLRDQKWSVADISKNLKVTPAYVELILERYRS